ncbi:aldose epimerase family protein [Salegentibacter salegens]|uniref:Aldose 1-epimerase n=1 Tax=Salegentibacter salegens TaxID=143223 RepID=A0A1M7N6C0_9FLAO|nr:aldose epimerase family protein [Salegentibacter salegens]PRX46859.1 aldose 1-epimerase [Salegentibacter salegens]SHM98623.1 aldose 1-epimerase [Salegentibacter salegens]
MNISKNNLFGFGIVFLSLFFIQCKNADKEAETKENEMNTEKSQKTEMQKEDYGTTGDGEKVAQYTLTNDNGMEVKIITYGGRITSLKAPDKNDEFENVVLGFNSLEQYTKDNPFFGALIGRFGNRIAKGKFTLDGEEYTLAQNDGQNHLHGGEKGFDKVVWTVDDASANSISLSYISEDMEEGYPGKLETTVVYTLTDDNALDVDYKATTDKTTVVNLTQHAYFNLSGNFSETILDHKIEINADEFLPVNETLIPTGELKEVAGTPFDFREAKTVEQHIEEKNQQLKRGQGYDHCWVLNQQDSGMRFAASAYHEESGRMLEVHTNEPGIQFYSGNFLDGTLPQANGEGNYGHRSGFCLETQHYPDSPNQEGFPSVVLKPGETYSSKTSFKFSVK